MEPIQEKTGALSKIKFKPEISLGNVISMSMFLLAIISFFLTQENRITKLEVGTVAYAATQKQIDINQDDKLTAFKDEVLKQLDRIESKLDRK